MGSTAPPMGQPLPFKDGEYQSLSQNAAVTWKFKDVEIPSPLYITRDDQIVVQVSSQAGGDVFNVNGRLLTVDGKVISIQRQLNTSASLTATTTLISGVEGFLLSLAIFDTNALQRGQAFARAWLNRGLLALTNAAQLLVSDYVTQFTPANWPGDMLKDPTEGPGELTSVQVSNPAAGADWGFNPGNRLRANVYSINAQLVTSIGAANRNVQVQILDANGHIVYQNSAAVSIVASTTAQVTFTPGNSQTQVVTTDVTILLPQPCIVMPAGLLQTSTVGIQVGDQWSNIWVMAERLIQGV
jgi:hypothetical protein